MIRREIEDKKVERIQDQHLGVSDVDCDPENGSRIAQVAKSEI